MNEIKYPKIRWFILFAMFIAITSSAISMIAPAPMVGAISQILNISIGEATGITMGTFNLFLAFGCLGGGVLIDKFGPLKMIFVGLILIFVGSTLVFMLGDSSTGVMIGRAIQGLGTGPLMACPPAIAAVWFPAKERSIVTGVQGFSVAAGVTVGFIVGPQVFTNTNDWKLTIAYLTIFVLTALVIVIASMILGKHIPESESNSEINEPLSNNVAKDLKIALGLISTWAVIASLFLNSWAYQAFNDMTPGYLAIDPPTGLGKGVVAAGSLMVGAQFAFMFGSIISGFITEKLLKGKVKYSIAVGFGVSSVLVASIKIPSVYSNQSLLFICLTLAGFFLSFVNPQAFGFIAKYYPTHIVGKLGGMAMGIGVFGSTAGVAAGAYFLHSTKLYNMSIIIVSTVCIVGVISALFLNKPNAFKND